jgi:hypothetical protein
MDAGRSSELAPEDCIQRSAGFGSFLGDLGVHEALRDQFRSLKAGSMVVYSMEAQMRLLYGRSGRRSASRVRRVIAVRSLERHNDRCMRHRCLGLPPNNLFGRRSECLRTSCSTGRRDDICAPEFNRFLFWHCTCESCPRGSAG